MEWLCGDVDVGYCKVKCVFVCSGLEKVFLVGYVGVYVCCWKLYVLENDGFVDGYCGFFGSIDV